MKDRTDSTSNINSAINPDINLENLGELENGKTNLADLDTVSLAPGQSEPLESPGIRRPAVNQKNLVVELVFPSPN
ncbi:MAG: hypothetical protein HC930_13565 [Hydrococcus sp. SU_1_0]|nr:hypothetical protein [Hydrococcus sp. SU_1_0]